MVDEDLMRDLNSVRSALSGLVPDGSKYLQWFISFGSLLYLIRDRRQGTEFRQDVDISVVGSHNFGQIENSLLSDGFKAEGRIINDQTGDILFADFQSRHGLNVDLFFWVGHNGYLWHTYDYMAEQNPDGIPHRYHFKGTPAWMLKGDPYKVRWFDEIDCLNVPNKYGTLLDYWYPNWFIPDSEFGVSRAQAIREPKTCENLKGALHV